jgi:hypothetical protein
MKNQRGNPTARLFSLSADSDVNIYNRVFEQIGLTDDDWEIELLQD